MTGPRIRLLVVDDSNFVRIALRMMLEPASDIEIVGEARNGAEALRLSRKLKPHVVAMDLNMPIMDGLKLVKRVRTDPVHKDVPIVIITTESAEEDRQRALSLGANAYITKPIQAPQVIAKVRELLGIDSSPPSSSIPNAPSST